VVAWAVADNIGMVRVPQSGGMVEILEVIKADVVELSKLLHCVIDLLHLATVGQGLILHCQGL